MKTLTLEQWEQQYVSGQIARFDQKYTGFRRVTWDENLKERLSDWAFSGEVQSKPGYDMMDQALRWASRSGTDMGLLNTSRPNTPELSLQIAELVAKQRGNMMWSHDQTGAPKLDVTDPAAMSRHIKNVARFFGADIIGICKLDRRWLYSHNHYADYGEIIYKEQHVPEEYQYAIVMGYEEDYELLKYFPTYLADAATSRGYARMAITNAHLAAFIRGLGYKVIDCTTNDVALSIPLAMQAGLGQLGRNGLLVSREFGPRLRLSKLLTDLPLEIDQPIDFGVTEFCNACKKCARLCPSQAIWQEERTAQPRNESNAPGALKWPLDAEQCRMYWGRMSKPCTNCISVCPFNKEMGGWFHKTVSWFVDHARWGDSLYVKMDDWFGYGKPQKPDGFWDKWQP